METQELLLLPQSVQNLVRFGIARLAPDKIILFGSRARGDHGESSDYDIVILGAFDPAQWAAFAVESDERPLTLLKVDLLNYRDCNEEYRKQIARDGKVLYEA